MVKLIDLSDFKVEISRHQTNFHNIASNFKKTREQIKLDTGSRKDEFLTPNKAKFSSAVKDSVLNTTTAANLSTEGQNCTLTWKGQKSSSLAKT